LLDSLLQEIKTCFNMSSSFIFVNSLLEGIVEEVMMADEGEEENSMELSFSSTPDHPLPCSEDFHFFLSIAKTVPPHSPDSVSLSCSGVTPPSSQLCTATPGRSSCTPSPPPSPGITLLPLSGQITQAVVQEFKNRYHEEEPARKMFKLEAEEHTDLLENVDILDEDNDDSADDESPPLPLTFTTPADLMWKLQKAEIIPPRPVFCNLGEQKNGREVNSMEQGRTDMREEVVVDADTVDRHSFDEQSMIIRDREVMMGSVGVLAETVDIIKEEKEKVIFNEVDVVVEVENDVMEENDQSVKEDKLEVSMEEKNASYRPIGRVNLLNKPPRLGLSKLYKSSTSLHDISIIEKGDKNVKRQRELFIVEKEE